MNRSITFVGVSVVLAGLGLVAFPIVLFAREVFDLFQEAGVFLIPVGLLVVMIGGVQPNPERTTVRGTFGNPDLRAVRSTASPAATSPRAVGYNPREPVACRHCRTLIPFDLALCPRCARARSCRSCGRPLGMAEDRTDCPGCRKVEAFCHCPQLVHPSGAGPTIYAHPRRG